MALLLANQVAGTLASAVSPGATTMALSPALNSTALPTANGADYYYLTIIDAGSYAGQVSPPAQREIVKVTGSSGNTITAMLRGQDGTTPQQWAAGDRYELRLNAAAFTGGAAGFMTLDSYNSTTNTFRWTIEPNQTYDQALGVLASTIFINPASTVTVPTLMQNDVIRVDATVEGEGTGSFGAIRMNIEDVSTSATAESNSIICANYGPGAGIMKAIYGRASMLPGNTGVAVGLVGAVVSVATGNTAWAMQLAHTGPSSGQSAFIAMGSDGVNSMPNGVYFADSVLINGGGAAIQWNQNAAQDLAAFFLRIYNSTPTEVFSVSATGFTKLGGFQFTNNPPVYANNTDAVNGGLVAGQIYRTGGDPDVLCVVD